MSLGFDSQNIIDARAIFVARLLQKEDCALAGVAQGTECWPVNQRMAGSVPRHVWVAGQVPSWGHARGNQLISLSHNNVSLPLFLHPSPLSKNK